MNKQKESRKPRETSWYGWHFLKEDRKLQFPPHTKVKAGQTLKHKSKLPIELCVRGLHASKTPRDALKYAPGSVLCYVRLSGQIIDSDDKSVATERTVLWVVDVSELLHRMAIWSAKQSFQVQKKLGNKIDPRSIAAVKAKEFWLTGKITDADCVAESRKYYNYTENISYPHGATFLDQFAIRENDMGELNVKEFELI